MRIIRTFAIVIILSFVLQTSLVELAQSNPSMQPNIILILTDDLDLYPETLATMPNLQQLLIGHGMNFTNAIVPMPSCCPSRASVLTGKYVHNHGVTANAPPNGGYPRFLERGEEALTVGTMLEEAGYRTVLLGKYLNHYPLETAPNHVPAGWTEWYAHAKGGLFRTYVLNENGTWVKYKKVPENYSTDIYSQKTVDFIQRSARDHSEQPFFVYLAPYAPHHPAHAAPRHEALFADVQAPRTAAYNEADVTDKPNWVAKLDPLTREQERFIDDFYRNRLRSMQAIDEMIAAIYTALVDTGQLDNTYIIFTSDNGMHLGEHRIVYGKGTAYEASIRVPFVVRGPEVPAQSEQAAVINLVDLAPTFGAMAGLHELPASFDGRSILPLLSAPPTANNVITETWRAAVLFDRPDNSGGTTTSVNATTQAIDELPSPVEADAATSDYPIVVGKDGIPQLLLDAEGGKPETSGGMASVGFRTSTYKYVEYKNGDRELYDMVNDPLELENQAANAQPELLTMLSMHLAALYACAGTACRLADMQMPRDVFPLDGVVIQPTATATTTGVATPTATATSEPFATTTSTPTTVMTGTALPTSIPTATATSTPSATVMATASPTSTPTVLLARTPIPTATAKSLDGSGATATPVFRQYLPLVGTD